MRLRRPFNMLPRPQSQLTRRALLSAATLMLLAPSSVATENRRNWLVRVGTRREGQIPRDLGPATGQEVSFLTTERQGTILIDTGVNILYLVLGSDRALAYRVGVGREGFGWTGTVEVGAKAEWPSWRPPAEMRARDPRLPEYVPPGPLNPLGARAIYLHRNGVDTLYRIHGTNENQTVGGNASSGCFRLTNTDVIDLYDRVRIGTRVVVF
jgi:lipoprotein-anchoring transpeptidase ErfK/SrfK